MDEALYAHLAHLMRRFDVNGYAASVKVFAVKPRLWIPDIQEPPRWGGMMRRISERRFNPTRLQPAS